MKLAIGFPSQKVDDHRDEYTIKYTNLLTSNQQLPYLSGYKTGVLSL